jgi:hypothetical protein
MQGSKALVAVASFDTVAEAAVVQALIEGDGIPVHASNSGLVGLDWSFSQAVGGVRLMVPGEHADAASALVAAYRDGSLAAGDTDAGPAATGLCPRCGSSRIDTKAPAGEKSLLVFMTLLFSAMFPTSNNHRRCRDCGFEGVAPD